MSAAATAKAKHTDLWMILSESGRYHTVHGWSSRPHDEVRVIGQKTDCAEIHHDLDKVALAAVTELESRHGASDLRVEVVGGHGRQGNVAVDAKHVAVLAIRTLHNHAVRSINAEPAEYVRRFDAALAKYDAAFKAFKQRLEVR